MIPLVIVVGLLLLSALFSSSELAIMGVPKYKIKKYILEHHPDTRRAELLLRLREKGERTLIAILIGNNLVNVVLSIYASQLGDTVLGSVALSGAMAFVLVSVSITFLILLFGEIIPKVFATKFALKFGLSVAPLVRGVIVILFPFVRGLEQIIKMIERVLGGEEETVSKEDVDIFLEEGRKQGIFSKTESLIVHNLLEFRDRHVESVFTHRTDIVAFSEEETLHDAVIKILENPHSRIPLYRDDKDNMIGLVTLREAMRLYVDPQNHQKKLKEFGFNKIIKVPITANIFDVFMDMKKYGWHFAVVIDEFGGTAGIVTFEDILEDLVGAIRDESDAWDENEIVRIDDDVLRVKGEALLRDVVDMLQLVGFKIPEDMADYISEEDTISYIIIHYLKNFARKGDVVRIGQLMLEVVRVNKSGEKIEKVLVTIVHEETITQEMHHEGHQY